MRIPKNPTEQEKRKIYQEFQAIEQRALQKIKERIEILAKDEKLKAEMYAEIQAYNNAEQKLPKGRKKREKASKRSKRAK